VIGKGSKATGDQLVVGAAVFDFSAYGIPEEGGLRFAFLKYAFYSSAKFGIDIPCR
jgi:hypothetical protein